MLKHKNSQAYRVKSDSTLVAHIKKTAEHARSLPACEQHILGRPTNGAPPEVRRASQRD